MEPVVNPDESLAELYHQRRRLSKEIATGDVLKKLVICNSKIMMVEEAMQIPGKQVRLL